MSETEPAVVPSSAIGSGPMAEYYRLKYNLLTITSVLSIGIFFCVWGVYSLSIALNYLLGAVVGVIFLVLLARNVEAIGGQNQRLGKSHLAIFVGLIVIACRWDQLQILPVFLGFLTYKVTLLIYVLQAAFGSNSS
jgi:ATP synthase protein I